MKNCLILCLFFLMFMTLSFAQEELPQEEIAEAPIMMEEDSRPVYQSFDQEISPYPNSELGHFEEEQETIQ